MKTNEHPNPADIIDQKVMGYIFEPDDDEIIFVLEKVNIRVPFSTLVMKYREESI